MKIKWNLKFYRKKGITHTHARQKTRLNRSPHPFFLSHEIGCASRGRCPFIGNAHAQITEPLCEGGGESSASSWQRQRQWQQQQQQHQNRNRNRNQRPQQLRASARRSSRKKKESRARTLVAFRSFSLSYAVYVCLCGCRSLKCKHWSPSVAGPEDRGRAKSEGGCSTALCAAKRPLLRISCN